jgi:hypothetical protein
MAGNPRVFFDVTIGGKAGGRIEFEVCRKKQRKGRYLGIFFFFFSLDRLTLSL